MGSRIKQSVIEVIRHCLFDWKVHSELDVHARYLG